MTSITTPIEMPFLQRVENGKVVDDRHFGLPVTAGASVGLVAGAIAATAMSAAPPMLRIGTALGIGAVGATIGALLTPHHRQWESEGLKAPMTSAELADAYIGAYDTNHDGKVQVDQELPIGAYLGAYADHNFGNDDGVATKGELTEKFHWIDRLQHNGDIQNAKHPTDGFDNGSIDPGYEWNLLKAFTGQPFDRSAVGLDD